MENFENLVLDLVTVPVQTNVLLELKKNHVTKMDLDLENNKFEDIFSEFNEFTEEVIRENIADVESEEEYDKFIEELARDSYDYVFKKYKKEKEETPKKGDTSKKTVEDKVEYLKEKLYENNVSYKQLSDNKFKVKIVQAFIEDEETEVIIEVTEDEDYYVVKFENSYFWVPVNKENLDTFLVQVI